MAVVQNINGIHDNKEELAGLFLLVFEKEIKAFSRKSQMGLRIIIISLILSAFSILLLFSSNNDIADVSKFLSVFFGVLTLSSIIFYLTLNPSKKLKDIRILSIPFIHSKLQDDSVLIDLSGITPPSRFEFTSLQNKDILRFRDRYNQLLERIGTMPIIISSDKCLLSPSGLNGDKKSVKLFTEELELLNHFSDIKEIISHKKTKRTELPLVKQDKQLLSFLRESTKRKGSSDLNESESEYIKRIQQLDGIVESREKTEKLIDIDELCSNLFDFTKASSDNYCQTMDFSINDVLNPSHLLLNHQISEIALNMYCPHCNKERIEHIENGKYYHNKDIGENQKDFKSGTKLLLIDPDNLEYLCQVCEQKTMEPLRRHKMDDELFTPMYDALSEEHFKERLDIYNSINDQKRKYLEKASSQFHEVMRESRTKEDLIKSKIRSIGAEIMAEQSAIEELNQLLMKYDRIEVDRANEIARDISQIKQNVQFENEKAREEIQAVTEKAQQSINESTEKYATLEREDQEKRDAIQKQIAEDIKEIRTIEEVRAHEAGMDEKPKKFLWIPYGKTRRDNAKTKMKKQALKEAKTRKKAN